MTWFAQKLTFVSRFLQKLASEFLNDFFCWVHSLFLHLTFFVRAALFSFSVLHTHPNFAAAMIVLTLQDRATIF